MRRFPPFSGLLLFAAWIAIEITVFNLVAGWAGGGIAFFLLVMKSVLGAMFVSRVVKQKLFTILRRGGGAFVLDGSAAAEAWLKGLGALLLIAPGFFAGVVGLALLNPSFRRLLMGRSAGRPRNPREIELPAEEWRDISEGTPKRIRRRKNFDEA
ncbi:MAG: FxsA family protein [Methylocystis sp.]|nr:FxsA family protein [Methylocystis sp.]MCA3583637.1 FxsA family protein [Methylocystis sp.]MCA3586573.1 FxsA family protein [Methylocystis sp.]MCA3593276.1 FxsA family protein [Methylocystis sp.]